jgi:hypothetical protein
MERPRGNESLLYTIDDLFSLEEGEYPIDLPPEQLNDEVYPYFFNEIKEARRAINNANSKYREYQELKAKHKFIAKMKPYFVYVPEDPTVSEYVKRCNEKIVVCNDAMDELANGNGHTAEKFVLDKLHSNYRTLKMRNTDSMRSTQFVARDEADSALGILFLLDPTRTRRLISLFQDVSYIGSFEKIFKK